MKRVTQRDDCPGMTVAEFVGSLAVMGGWLTLEGSRIRLNGPPKFLSPGSFRRYINDHRQELRRFLSAPRTELTQGEIEAYARVLPAAVIDGLRGGRGDPQVLLDFIVLECEAAVDAVYPDLEGLW